MQITSRSAPLIGALLMLSACAENALAPTALDAGKQPLDIVVPNLGAPGASAATRPGGGPQRTGDLPLPPELEGENVPTEFLTAPGIIAYDVSIGAGSGEVTAYAWMLYWATGGRIALTLATMGNDRPGFSTTMPVEDVSLFPATRSLNNVVSLPFTYPCGAAASAQGVFSAWHQFPTKFGALLRWGDATANKQRNLVQESCVKEYTSEPWRYSGGGTAREDAVLPEAGAWWLCTWTLTYIDNVLVSIVETNCVRVA